MLIGIVDYGMGNLRSVANALESLGCVTKITARPADLGSVDRIVLPGVGAFGDGINNLRTGGWIPALEEEVLKKSKPFLGLCVGMQLLASKGTEHGNSEGLGWIPGVVRRLTSSNPSIRIPHIGWNGVEIAKHDGLYREAKGEQTFYFVHSYAFYPDDPSVVSAWCNHGEGFPASLETRNIFAAQYHPEKSQKCGIAVLQNFLRIE
jgi:imidazole glycerol-phosphate synthase subunit HisH